VLVHGHEVLLRPRFACRLLGPRTLSQTINISQTSFLADEIRTSSSRPCWRHGWHTGWLPSHPIFLPADECFYSTAKLDDAYFLAHTSHAGWYFPRPRGLPEPEVFVFINATARFPIRRLAIVRTDQKLRESLKDVKQIMDMVE
jgi:hypothetical protein